MVARALAGIALLVAATSAAAGDARGTLVHKATTVQLRHAFLVKGPSELDPKRTIRRLVLSSKDAGTTLRACQTMSCTADETIEGVTVDLDAGPRLNLWVALNGGLIQHSDTAPTTALKATTDDARRLAGKLSFDAAGRGGPRLEVEFDAPLLKELTRAR
jgi:hypothetical protein